MHTPVHKDQWRVMLLGQPTRGVSYRLASSTTHYGLEVVRRAMYATCLFCNRPLGALTRASSGYR